MRPEAEVKELVDEVPILRWMVRKDRPKARDLARDTRGRVKVDITKPHVLEDMDYFRQPALHFKKYGVYTNLMPNPHPASDYMAFWREEMRRCIEGHIRPDDGEWIPGYYYWYLNYSPILLTKEHEDQIEGSRVKRAERIIDFPHVWDSDYLYYHYLDQAERSGLHGAVLKTRGRGYSFKAASVLCRNFFMIPESKSYALAAEGEYLQGDALLDKAWAIMSFIDQMTPWTKAKEFKNTNMHKQASYRDQKTGAIRGYRSEIMGVTLKNQPERARGKRGKIIMFEESGKFPHLLKAWAIARPSMEDGNYTFGTMIAFGTGGCLTGGQKVWNHSGELVAIKDLTRSQGIIGFKEGFNKEPITWWQPPSEKECLVFTTNSGRTLECSLDHPIYKGVQRQGRGNIIGHEFVPAESLQVGDHVAVIDEVPIWSSRELPHARTVGWVVGDGTYGENQSTRIANCEPEILEHLEDNYDCKTLVERKTKDGRVYKELRIGDFNKHLRAVGIYGQVKQNKRLPDNIHSYSKESVCSFLGGLFDTDGYVSIRPNKSRPGKFICEVSLSQSSEELIKETLLLLQKLGIHGKIRKRLPRESHALDKNPWFELCIRDAKSLIRFKENITLFPKEKQDRLDRIHDYCTSIKALGSAHIGLRHERVVSLERTGFKPVYNLTAGDSNTYIGNGIITHNTEGADFDGIRQLFSEPEGYRVYGIRNVFDRKGGNTECGWYCGEYLNRKGFYDENGNSDVAAALLEVFQEREVVRQSTTDPNAMIQEKADRSVTPQEAMMKREGNLFPVEDIKAHQAEVELNPKKWTDANWKVDLIIKDGAVDYRVSDKYPVRVYPIRDNKGYEGCVEIREHPADHDGHIPYGLYIAGIDPYDDDTSTTTSLGSIVVMHRLTGRIVAEFTGRPSTAEKFYEVCYRLMKYYNAIGNYENNKKGMFAYFDKKNALHMLCDTPQILKDMQITKMVGSGNTAKGTNATNAVNAWGRSLLKSWLLDSAYGHEDDDALNLHTLWSPAMMKELINFDPDEGNYDRVSALGMLMILKEDMHRVDSTREEKTDYTGILAKRPSARRKGHKQDNFFTRTPYMPVHKRAKNL